MKSIDEVIAFIEQSTDLNELVEFYDALNEPSSENFEKQKEALKKAILSYQSGYIPKKLAQARRELDELVFSPSIDNSIRRNLANPFFWHGRPSLSEYPALPPLEEYIQSLVKDSVITKETADKYLVIAKAIKRYTMHEALYTIFDKSTPSWRVAEALIELPDFNYVNIYGGTESYKDIKVPKKISEIVRQHFGENIPENFERFSVIHQIYADHFLDKDEFNGWVAQPKLSGKDLGFILKEPNSQERWFVKHTGNDINEYFVSLLLNQLGVKYPEAKLFKSDTGMYFIATKDVKRRYTKKEIEKHKEFDSLIFDEDPRAQLLARNSESKVFSEYTPHEQEQILSFVDDIFGPKGSTEVKYVKMRESFAKMLICANLLGMSDLGTHLGNIGIIKRPSGENESKLGIVDFQTHINPISVEANVGLEQYLLTRFEKMHVHFLMRMFAERLTADDIKQALHEINNPKSRKEIKGMFLTEKKEHSLNFEGVLNSCFEQFKKNLPSGTSERDVEIVQKMMGTIVQNLQTINHLSTNASADPDKAERLSPKP